MRNPDLRSCFTSRGWRYIRFATLPLLTVGMLAAILPIRSASALFFDPYDPSPYRAQKSDYSACASGLKGAGIASADAASACASTLYPRDLSICVDDIKGTSIQASDALLGCRRVRRPVELATCVTEISSTGVEKDKLMDVLDSCRRSLLPRRFSNCVVGLRSQLTLATEDALSTCIAASSRPRAAVSGFIPRDSTATPSPPNPFQSFPGTPNPSQTTAPMQTTPESTPMPSPSQQPAAPQ